MYNIIVYPKTNNNNNNIKKYNLHICNIFENETL